LPNFDLQHGPDESQVLSSYLNICGVPLSQLLENLACLLILPPYPVICDGSVQELISFLFDAITGN